MHTSRADACADYALMAFSSSPSSDPAANSFARAFTSCTVSEGSLRGSLSELGAGAIFFFCFCGLCFAAGTQLCSSNRGSDSSISLLFGAIFRFFVAAPLAILALISATCCQSLRRSWAVLQALDISLSVRGALSGRTETGTLEPLCCRGCSPLVLGVELEAVGASRASHCSLMLQVLQVGGATQSCREL